MLKALKKVIRVTKKSNKVQSKKKYYKGVKKHII